MAKIGLGDQLVLMQGFDRQKAVSNNPVKKAKRFHFRRSAAPSQSKEVLQARLCLAEAAVGARGRSFEEVVAAVQTSCAGKDYGGSRKASARRAARQASADASIARMRRMISAGGG